MVLHEPGSITRHIFGRAYASQGVQSRVLLELDSREAVTKAVVAELGVGVVFFLEVGNNPRVRAMPLVDPELTNYHLINYLEKRRGLRVTKASPELAVAWVTPPAPVALVGVTVFAEVEQRGQRIHDQLGDPGNQQGMAQASGDHPGLEQDLVAAVGIGFRQQLMV